MDSEHDGKWCGAVVQEKRVIVHYSAEGGMRQPRTISVNWADMIILL